MKRKIQDTLGIIWIILVPVLIIIGIIHVVNDFDEFGLLFNTATTGVELIKFLLGCCYEVIKDSIITILTIIIWICGAEIISEL